MKTSDFLRQALNDNRLDTNEEPLYSRQLPAGQYKEIEDRGIQASTCKTYDYQVGLYHGNKAHFARIRDQKGEVTGVHVRKFPKTFAWVNKPSKAQLFGQHLGSTDHLIICEGQIDAMSVYQCQAGFLPNTIVVSTTSGVGNAVNDVKANLSYVQSFNRVTLFFDQDTAGREGAQKVADLLGGGTKLRVVTGLPYKDANEALVQGDHQAIKTAIKTAPAFVPEGVVEAGDLLDRVLNPEKNTDHQLAWEGWNDMTMGLREGEVWLLGAGTGIGKSLFTRSMCLHLCKHGVKCAYIGLEERAETTLERMLSEELGWPLHLSTPAKRKEKQEAIRESMKRFAPNLLLLDKFGSDDLDKFKKTVKHYVLNEECEVVFLDHISLLADGVALNVDQRRSIDKTIKELKECAIENKFTFVIVSHLSRGSGLSHETGEGENGPNLNELRGSQSLAQYPDYIIMLSRNPHDRQNPNLTSCWLKKNRVKGTQGLMAKLEFDPETCQFEEQYAARGSI